MLHGYGHLYTGVPITISTYTVVTEIGIREMHAHKSIADIPPRLCIFQEIPVVYILVVMLCLSYPLITRLSIAIPAGWAGLQPVPVSSKQLLLCNK